MVAALDFDGDDEAETFLRELYGDDPHGWITASRKTPSGVWLSDSFQDSSDAARWTVKYGSECDVYFGVATRKVSFSGGSRGKEEDVRALVALWAEVDLKKTEDDTGRPATVEEAADIANCAIPGFVPTAIVASGGGIHAYWLLDVPLDVRDIGSVKAATGAVVAAVRDEALRRGYSDAVDEVSDLARVLRVPSTLNYKYAPPRPVRLLEEHTDWTRRYEYTAIIDAIPEDCWQAENESSNLTARDRVGVDKWDRLVIKEFALASAAITSGGSRHNAARAGALDLVRLEALEYPGAADALEHLGATFRNAIADRSNVRQSKKEWNDLVDSARNVVKVTDATLPHYVDITSYLEKFRKAKQHSATAGEQQPADSSSEDGDPVEAATDAAAADPEADDCFTHIRDELDADPDLLGAFKQHRNRERARELLAEVRELQQPPRPFSDGLLSTYPETVAEMRIAGVLPKDGRLLIVAQRKTGKTQLSLAIANALLHTSDEDAALFLGRYEVEPITGNVGFLNYEVSDATFNAWARAHGIRGDRFYVNHLRGTPNPFRTDRDLDRLAQRLIEHNVQALVIDPFARAFSGDNIDNTKQAIDFTDRVDQLIDKIGATEVIVTNHAGWNKERGRNSTVLEDWVDSIVTMVRDGDKRYLSAIGRDVDIPEDEIILDPTTMRFTLAGTGQRKQRATSGQTAKMKRISELVPIVTEIVRLAGHSMNLTEIQDALDGRDVPYSRGEVGVAAGRSLDLREVKGQKPNERRFEYIADSASDRWEASK